MRAKPVAALAALSVLMTLAAASACREPTHLALELTTDVSCGERITTAIVVGTLQDSAKSLDERPATTQTSACTQRGAGDGFIGTLAITPSGDDTDEVAIKVVAGIGIPPEQCTDPKDKRCIVARRVRKYAPHTKVTVPIVLNDACRGVPCGADETCSRGSCVSVRCEDLGTCEPPAPPQRDAGREDAADASSEDAGDAAGDASPDAGPQANYKLALGHTFTCALRTRDHAVFCWGDNTKGQVGSAAGVAPVTTPTPVVWPSSPAGPVVELVAAADRVLARLENGDVWGWGMGNSGNLGDVDGPILPRRLWAGLKGVTAVAAGRDSTCLRLGGGSVQCFGSKTSGVVYPDTGFAEHCCGSTFLVGRAADGGVFGARWEVGAPNPMDSAPFALDAGVVSFGLNGTRSIHCGDSFGLVQMADGGVVGWGSNVPDPFTGEFLNVEYPKVFISSLAGYSSLSAGVDHVCGINSGDVYCWGSGESGAVDGTVGPNHPIPVKLAFGSSPAAAVYAGWTHSCAVLTDNTVWCWGSNQNGQLAQTGLASSGPIRIPLQP